MADRYRTWRGDVALRAAGTGACALACLAVGQVVHAHAVVGARWVPNALAYGLTGLAFLAASMGSVMVVLGRHLFDRVEISDRWRTGSAAPSRLRAESAERLGP